MCCYCQDAVTGLHKSGRLHSLIMRDLASYIDKQKHVSELILRLSAAGKKLFLITNSAFLFVYVTSIIPTRILADCSVTSFSIRSIFLSNICVEMLVISKISLFGFVYQLK